MSRFKWQEVNLAPGEAVGPPQRLSWGKTVGLGAQHVVAMFGEPFTTWSTSRPKAAGAEEVTKVL